MRKTRNFPRPYSMLFLKQDKTNRQSSESCFANGRVGPCFPFVVPFSIAAVAHGEIVLIPSSIIRFVLCPVGVGETLPCRRPNPEAFVTEVRSRCPVLLLRSIFDRPLLQNSLILLFCFNRHQLHLICFTVSPGQGPTPLFSKKSNHFSGLSYLPDFTV